ncbi:hypothetical protein ABTK82_20125, partial [Acinetobacter baumannii]
GRRDRIAAATPEDGDGDPWLALHRGPRLGCRRPGAVLRTLGPLRIPAGHGGGTGVDAVQAAASVGAGRADCGGSICAVCPSAAGG